MPLYIYTAKDASGNTKVDRTEADTESELVSRLKEQGLYVVSLQELGVQAQKGNGFSLSSLSFEKLMALFPVSRTEKMMSVRNLAVMIGAGLSLNRGLEALSEQTSSSKFKKVLLSLNESVAKGVSFADSLAKFPNEFNELFISMVRVGEAAGTLEETLIVLYRQLKKDHELRSRIRGALIYPAVIVSAMVLIGALMMIYVVPTLAQTFSELDVDLPLSTRVIIWIAENLSRVWPFILAGIAGIVVGIRFFARTKNGKRFFDRMFLEAPLIGSIVKKVNAARFARTLSSLIEAGLPIVRALEITANTVSNSFYKDSLAEAGVVLEKGGQLSSVVKQYPKLYQPMVMQMIAVGEETGALSSLLKRIAVFFESEVNSITKNLSSIIEPILMVIIGAVVGFFAVSMLQPMYSLVGTL